MNFADLKKEHKQALALVAMWIIGGVFALYHFVLMPFLKEKGQSKGELETLTTQIKKAEVAMEGESKVRTEFALSLKELERVMDLYIVPIDNPLSWVTEKAYGYARNVDVDITSVSEIGGVSPGWDRLVKSERTFKPYAVRIALAATGYADLLKLIGEMESDNPYLCVTGIAILGNDQYVTKHQITLLVEWPMWGRQVQIGAATKKARARG